MQNSTKMHARFIKTIQSLSNYDRFILLSNSFQWSYSLLIDNDIADSHFYLIRVYTGMRSGSGTDSKVGFVLVGTAGDTGVRRLNDESEVVRY